MRADNLDYLRKQAKALLKKARDGDAAAHIIARNWNGCDVWMAFFRDPFGNLLGLKSDVPVKKSR